MKKLIMVSCAACLMAVGKCIEPPPYITVTIDGAATKTVTADANYASSKARLTVTLSEAFTNEFTVNITPSMVSGSATVPLGKYVSLSPYSEDGYLFGTHALTFPAGTLSKDLFIYVLGGDDDTAGAGKGIKFEAAADEADAAAYFCNENVSATLSIRKSTPVIAFPTEDYAYTGLAGGVNTAFTVRIADDYADIQQPYTIEWYKTGSGSPLTIDNLTPNADGEVTFPVRYNYQENPYSTTFRAKNSNGVWSDYRRVSVQVNPAKQVSAVIESPDDSGEYPEYDDGDVELSIRFKLTEGYDDATLYAFLVPQDEASFNLVVCKAFTTGVAIMSGDTNSTATAKMLLLDGNDDSMPLVYSIVLRTAKNWTSGDTIGIYESKDLEIYVNNVAPKVAAVNMSGSAPLTVNGGTFAGKATIGLNKIFSLEAEDVEADLTNDVTAVWTFVDPNGFAMSYTVTNRLEDIVLTNVFEVGGMYTGTVKLRDKDMGSKKYGPEFAFNVVVPDRPSLMIEFPDSSIFGETDANRGTSLFYVQLSTPAPQPIDVELECTRVGADGVLNLATNRVTFRAGQTQETVYISELDGTVESFAFRGGFSVTARVITESLNEDGIAWKDAYLPATTKMYVRNEAPTIDLPIDYGTTNTASINVEMPIDWKISDVAHDMTNNLAVTWDTSEGVHQVFSGDNVWEGVFTNVFRSGGNKTVTMNVTDKDNGVSSVTQYFRVVDDSQPGTYPGQSASIFNYYQAVTNLGPGASSRILLMNNDTNPICPIQGQGYHDTSSGVAVGQTYWWHDDTPLDETMTSSISVSDMLNLQSGTHHILYQKLSSGSRKLWELIDCRAGSSACGFSTVFNYLPWSSTCQPIDSEYSAPIPPEYTRGESYSNGMKQVAVITMRASIDAAICSPLYEDGIGDIFFDAVNVMRSYLNSHIAVEVDFEDGLGWRRVPCNVFKATKGVGCEIDPYNDGAMEVKMNVTTGCDNQYFRIRVPVNHYGPARFRIVRTNAEETGFLDYLDIIAIDNIIVSYPMPSAELSPADGVFTEPFLGVGQEGVKPRVAATILTEGLPPGIDWGVAVSNVCFVWRYQSPDGIYGDWRTNAMIAVGNDLLFEGDEMPFFASAGKIQCHYVADVYGTHYVFNDFANDEPLGIPGRNVCDSVRSEDFCVSVRAGESIWESFSLNVDTSGGKSTSIPMELIGDHVWRGIYYLGADSAGSGIRFSFQGLNAPAFNIQSRLWRMPSGTGTSLPSVGIASDDVDDGEARDIIIDHAPAQLTFEFNDETGMFAVNRVNDMGRFEGGMVDWPLSRSTSSSWWENFDQMAGNRDYPFNVPFGLDRITPNGWRASNGMFINGMFSAVTNKTTCGMALQLDGKGGSIALVDPADVPQGVGTVSFTARLAQKLRFEDFCYYIDGTGERNYAISAKAAMTHRKQPYSDVSTGTPSLSLVTYYRPNQGCYEFRISRVYATDNALWDNYGVMEIAIYKWHRTLDPNTDEYVWGSRKLKSLRLGGSSTMYNPQLSIGRYYTNGAARIQFINYFVPPVSASNASDVPDNKNWTSIYFAAYNTDGGTYLEGGVGGTYTTSTDARTDLMSTAGIMMSVNVTDADEPFLKGSYGVCANECPGTFGNIQTHTLAGTGPYKGRSAVFGTGISAQESISSGDWDCVAGTPRMIGWTERILVDGLDYRKDGSSQWYGYGICTLPLMQQLYLKMAPYGDSSNWTDSGMDLTLTGFSPTNVVFSPHTTTPSNVKIVTGNASSDVVVDNIELSQWTAEDSRSTDLGSVGKWTFTDAWIAGTTNDVYQSAGSFSDDDEVATISRCGYYVKKLSDTDFIYVFTNTTAGALSSYATFTPKVDITIKEVFILGGGGGGSPGGGGGGGGSALWITNAVDYSAGEGMHVYVGNGGGGGAARYSSNAIAPSAGGSGGNSYVLMKNPITLATTTYYGYGGGRGGTFRNSYDAGVNGTSSAGAGGGSARKSTARASGYPNYASGYGEPADDGAPGGGGGGGLRGLGGNGSNIALSNARSVIYAGSDGTNAVAGLHGGDGGDGFPLSVMGDSEVRAAIGELLGSLDAWLGGGGGGGSGCNTSANVATWGQGAETPGSGGQFSGGQGGLYTAGSYILDSMLAMGSSGMMYAGGGGGGGSFRNPVTSGSSTANNWIIGGGAGGAGLVVMHVRVKERFVMLQPMRGDENEPMSICTPFLNGISLFSFSWKRADSNAVLRVQVATNGVDVTTIRIRRRSLEDGWTDVCEPIRFAMMSESRRADGTMEIPLDIRAPTCGILRVLVEPSVVAAARAGVTSGLYSMYGAVPITDMAVENYPVLDKNDVTNGVVAATMPDGETVDVPMGWLVQYPELGVETNGSANVAHVSAFAAVNRSAANGTRSVAECYVLGLDPENADVTNDFRITSFPMLPNGMPDTEHIVFDPPQSRWNVPATYRVKGAVNLDDVYWFEVTDENKALLRFFKVEVVLP